MQIINGKGEIMQIISDSESKDLTFSKALELMKTGYCLARTGWNGRKNGLIMYVAYQKGYPDGITINANTQEAFKLPEGTVLKFMPYLSFVVGDLATPWMPSNMDLMTDDWEVYK